MHQLIKPQNSLMGLATPLSSFKMSVPPPAGELAQTSHPEDSEERRAKVMEDLKKEARDAFKFGRPTLRRKRRGGQQQADLTWLSFQCSPRGHVAGGESDLYPLYSGDRSKLTVLEKQTYRMWKSVMEFERVRHPIRQRRRVILIQPITHLHTNLHSGNGNHSNSIHLDGNSEVVGKVENKEEELVYRHTQIDGHVLELLQQFCAAYFSGMEVKLVPPLDLSEIFKLTSRIHKRTNRRQFLVDDIIDYMSSKKLKKAYCILGVTTVDLYPGPEWNFVLGQACAEKGSGVFSFGRYFHSTVAAKEIKETGSKRVPIESKGCDHEDKKFTESKEIEEEQTRNLWILMRVMSHELCHLFGLSHCHYFQCAMNDSGSISEAASQPLFLCPVCLRKFNHVQHVDLAQRYSNMLQVIEKLRTAVQKVTEDQQSPEIEGTIYEDRVETVSMAAKAVPISTVHGGEDGGGGEGGMDGGGGEGGVNGDESGGGEGGVDGDESGGGEGGVDGRGIKSGGGEGVMDGRRGGGDGEQCSENGKVPEEEAGVSTRSQLERIEAAIAWLKKAIRSIEEFQGHPS